MTGDAKAWGSKVLSIRAPGAPDFAPHIAKLLDTAGIENTQDAQADLESNLHLAWAVVQPDRPPRALPGKVAQLKESIKKTKALLRGLDQSEELRDLIFHTCPVGEGTISIAKFPGTLELPRKPPPLGHLPETRSRDDILVAINVSRLLDRVVREIDHFCKPRKKGNQEERDQHATVAYAAKFFRQYSMVEPTTYFTGPFVKFCRAFYEVVTGKTLTSSGLEKAIRKEVKKPTFGTQNPQKT